MAQPYQLTVAETAQQIKDNQLSPVELAQSLLERIDATDKELQSWAYHSKIYLKYQPKINKY